MLKNVEKRHYIWQRRMIGVFVLLLAPLSVLFGLIGAKYNPAGWWHSISDTYYSNSSIIMVSIVAIASFFFCTYAGYDWRDRVINLISGLGFFGLLVFPCGTEALAGTRVGLFCLPIEISGPIHLTFAFIAFGGFFVNEMFLFTLSENEITDGKKKRNRVYRICACSMFVAFALILMNNFFDFMPANTIWIAEFIALTGCGIAWLVKGEALKFLND